VALVSRTPRWVREPLVHFVIIGAAMFVAFHWRGAGGPGSNRIVITPGRVEAIVAGFTRTWQRAPTEEELKTQLDEYVREEIAAREAMAMGLDRDDSIVRRRLRQKLEFLAEDTADEGRPTDAELQAWLDVNGERFRTEPEVAFLQSPADGEHTFSLLPREVARTTRTDIARQFGDSFANAILKVDIGRWTGPIESDYGRHRVFVSERIDGRVPALAEVRQQVERDLVVERRRGQLESLYEDLLSRYRIIIQKPPPPPAAAAGMLR
jgi:hypothetical protein